MRLVFIDMHCINFLTNTLFQIKGGTKVKTFKHKFLIDYALKNGIKIANYVTGTDTTNINIMRLNAIARKLGISFLMNRYILKRCVKEAQYVISHNYGTEADIATITNLNEIQPDDIIIGYLLEAKQRATLKSISHKHKVMMGNHFIAIDEAYNFHDAGIQALVNEIDVSDNLFVNKYLNTSGIKNIICPYIYQDRFMDLGKERKNKAMAIGTLSSCKGSPGYNLYRKEFGTEWIQLMRKEIYEHAEEHTNEIDSYISYILEDKKKINPEDNAIIKIFKKIYNRYTGWTQTKYTSFDMVEKFNEYMMFICPEELVGMPGIGFVEGMACGTAYIGLDTSYYRNLGLIPNKHYITYDGTMQDLIKTIKFYQSHTEETQIIAKEGMKYVRENFNAQTVAKKFYQDLQELL